MDDDVAMHQEEDTNSDELEIEANAVDAEDDMLDEDNLQQMNDSQASSHHELDLVASNGYSCWNRQVNMLVDCHLVMFSSGDVVHFVLGCILKTGTRHCKLSLISASTQLLCTLTLKVDGLLINQIFRGRLVTSLR